MSDDGIEVVTHDGEVKIVELDESKLNDEQRQILADFRKEKVQRVPREEIDGWFKEMSEMTPENLPEFLEKVMNREQDQSSMVAAAAVCALATLKAFNRKHIFTNQGQGLKVANLIYVTMTGIGDDPFRVFEFYTILDPHCDGQIVSIPPQVFAVLRTKAKELLEKEPNAPEAFKKRWKQVANGKLPEPWVVRDFN